MLKARRPLGRLFHWFVLVAVLSVMPQVRAAGPSTTTVVDVIYRADGTPAQGTLLITWPAFATKQGEAVAPGTKSVKIGAAGAISIALAPNTGALPAGTHYKVTMKLDDGTTSTEYWVVPDSGETSVAAIRSKVVPAAMAAQFVARDYVDSALAGVSGGMVVHKSGDESVAGVKTFAVSPVIPVPTATSHAANKSYVDAADATAKSYVDALAATKATDATVVHKTGNEAVSGVKTFATSPAVPAPTTATDAANKGYVDGADATAKLYTDTSVSAAKTYADAAVAGAKEYADAAVAGARSYADTKASDAMVLHKSGDEAVAGVKSFAVPPVVPSPTNDQHAANKAYVDAATRNSGTSVLLKTNGLANSSQLTLDLKAGTNISLIDSGAGAITINSNAVSGPQGPAGGPFTGVVQVDGTTVANIQAGIAAAGTTKSVLIPADYAGTDSFTNPTNRPILDMRRLGLFRGGEISVADFGALGDKRSYSSLHMTAGSNAIVSDGVFFGSSDVGKQIVVMRAGVGGADLATTISAVADSQHATLAAVAGTSTPAGPPYYSTGVVVGGDDSAAFSAALAACKAAGGCTLKVPPGTYALNQTQVIANWAAEKRKNRVSIECVGGGNSTKIIWAGADAGVMFQVDDATMQAPPVTIKNCGFDSVDVLHLGTPMLAVGGTHHEFLNNHVGTSKYGVNWSQTWSGTIANNTFYGPDIAILFDNACNVFSNAQGRGDAGCPVNATKVMYNTLDYYGSYGIKSVTSGQGGAYENQYIANTIEGTSANTVADVQLNESGPLFIAGYMEAAGSSVAGYRNYLMNTVYGSFDFGEVIGCITVAGNNNVIKATNYGSRCAGQTWNIENAGLTNTWIGAFAGASFKNTPASRSDTVMGVGAESINTSGLLVEGGSKLGYTYPKVTIANALSIGASDSANSNPNRPAQMGTTTPIPQGTLIYNRYNPQGFGTTSPQDGAVFFVCAANPCQVPTVGSEWLRAGEVSAKVRREGTAPPATGNYLVGDFFWNTNPTGANPVLGWVCTVAGTPGTWVGIAATTPFVATAPGPIGSGTPSTVAATTLSTTGDITLTNGLTGKMHVDGVNGFVMYGTYTNATGIMTTTNAWIPTNNAGTPIDNAVDVGTTSQWLRTGRFKTSVITPTITLNTKAAYTCDSSTRGQFNYIAGGAGVKDIVQVCAKDASDVYAWRAVY